MSVRQWQWVWAATVLLVCCLGIFFETGLLPQGVCAGMDTLQYVMDCGAMALTLAGIVLGMRAAGRPWLRYVCFGVPLVVSLLVYFLFYSSTTLACAAAVAVAMLLQWPRANTPQI